MRKKQMGLLTLVWALLMTQTAFAHHGSSSSAISTQLSSLNGLSIRNAQKPVSLVYLNQEVSFLDEGQGELYTTTLGGSYAISTKLDVGAFVPLRYLQASRRSNEFGLGDMGVQTRFVFFEKNKHFAFAGITLTFPTGRDSVGLGSGFVAQDSQLGLSLKLGEWRVYSTQNFTVRYDNDPMPQWNAVLGLQTPSLLKDRVVLSLQVMNTLFMASDVFANNSGKLFLMPQANIYIDNNKRWLATMSGQISVYDYLSRASGVTLSQTNTLLLADSFFTGQLGISFLFR